MVSVHHTASSLILYYVASAVAAALPVNSTHELTKRQILHIGDVEDLWCDRILFEDYTSKGCTGRTYYSGRQPVEATKTTNIDKLDSGDSILLVANKPAGITSVCDSVLPPSFVLDRLRKSGACMEAAKSSTGQSIITAALGELDDPTNLRLLQHERLENFKTRLIRTGVPDLTLKRPTDLEKLKLMSYVLTNTAQTLAVAESIDNAILKKVKVQPGIKAAWNERLGKIRTMRSLLREQIERATGCDSRPGSPMDTSPGRKRAEKLKKRFLSIHESSGEGASSMPLSSLQRRVRPARSGPKAAKAPSCPMKNVPPKKTIPRSNVQPKPKPAVQPRRPAKAPQPRKPSPTKKVAPRPATRARRTPGKAAPQKRTTPKVKPRVVPKPTRKPKGKPRTRRRK